MIINHKSNYVERRKEVYPLIGDQLDAIYKLSKALQSTIDLPDEVNKWIKQIDKVKESYPKN